MNGIICIGGISAIAFRILLCVFDLSVVGFTAVPLPVRKACGFLNSRVSAQPLRPLRFCG